MPLLSPKDVPKAVEQRKEGQVRMRRLQVRHVPPEDVLRLPELPGVRAGLQAGLPCEEQQQDDAGEEEGGGDCQEEE